MLNCWEVQKCGREPGGASAEELGVCPAASDASSDGVNHGYNGGRYCWAVNWTLCEGERQGYAAEKLTRCLSCSFMELVQNEEGDEFQFLDRTFFSR